MVADRATVNQTSQIGVESTSTPGTSVAADKTLEAMTIEPGIKINEKSFMAQGHKYPSLIVPGREWMEAKLGGDQTFTEIIYPLCSIMGTVDPTLHTAGTLSMDWAFLPPISGNVVHPATFTVEKGDAVRAFKFSYGLVNDLSLKFTRDECTLSGNMIGQRITDGITLTASPDPIGVVPVLGNMVNVYMDSASGGLGTTQLVNMMEASLDYGGVYGTFWPLNRANASWARHVDLAPKAQLKILLEADAAGMALLASARAGTTQYIRINATSTAFIEGSIPYVLQIDAACKVSNVQPFADKDGIYAIEWTLDVVEDPTWDTGTALSVLVTNGLDGL